MTNLLHGVEIRQEPKGEFLVEVLFVDGKEVWCDWTSEPEDCVLSRDLASFVTALRKIAEERDRLREDLAATERDRADCEEDRVQGALTLMQAASLVDGALDAQADAERRMFVERQRAERAEACIREAAEICDEEEQIWNEAGDSEGAAAAGRCAARIRARGLK